MAEPEYGEALAFAAPSWIRIALLGFAAIIVFAGFSLFANFDRVAEIRGVVAPVAGMTRLVAPQSGIVSGLFVRQGAAVAQGAPLLRISSGNVHPTGAAAPEELVETYRRQQRLSDEAREAEAQRRRAELRRAQEDAAEVLETRRVLERRIALQRERIASNERRLANLASLRAKGHVSEVQYQEQEEAVLSLRQELAVLEQRAIEARHALAAARTRQSELAADARRAALERAGTRLALERGEAGAQRHAEVTLTSPIAGTVSALRAAPRMAVLADEPLVVIIPHDAAMEAHLFVPPRSAGFLRPGQPVVLRYDAFPYQRYGVGRGTVIEVASATATEPMAGGEPAYRVRVRLDAESGQRFALRPDMTLTASVTLERRSLAEWLFAPLRERMRERMERSSS